MKREFEKGRGIHLWIVLLCALCAFASLRQIGPARLAERLGRSLALPSLAFLGLLLFLVVERVALDEVVPLGGEVVLGEDGFHRALVDAEAAVDAGVVVD